MDVTIEPAPWPDRPKDRHLLYAAALLSFTGYLLFVLVHAILGPATLTAPASDHVARIPMRIKVRREPAPTTAVAAIPEPTNVQPSTTDATEKPAMTEAAVTPLTPEREAPSSVERAPAGATDRAPHPIDLTMPRPEAALRMPPVCRAGPCAPGTAPLPTIRTKRRPASEVLADLDPDVLERLDLEALGIDPALRDVFGERRHAVTRNCDLVQPADNVVTRQMGMPQFLRCRRSSVSKARAQALLDALREKRPDLFDEP